MKNNQNLQIENFRFEFKYAVDPITANYIENDIQKYRSYLDPHSSGGHYYVSSLYFDTPSLDDYYDKIAGLLKRRKIRARVYEKNITKETESIWFEQKYKHNMALCKSRIKITNNEWRNFLSQGASSLISKVQNNSKEKEIVWQLLKESRNPSVFVRYKRKPYLYNFYGEKEIRITFDSNIEAHLPCIKHNVGYTNPMAPVLPNLVVVEVKFNEVLPRWVASIIKNYNLKRDAFSKYALSIEAINHGNELPK